MAWTARPGRSPRAARRSARRSGCGERGQRVLQTDPELADDDVTRPLLCGFVLRQVLVAHRTVTADVPHAGIVLDDLLPGRGDRAGRARRRRWRSSRAA